MSEYPNYNIMESIGNQVTSIRSKNAMKLVVSLFKAIEEGDDISSINDILDQLIAERMHGIDINNYRFNLELYRNSQVGVSESCIVMPASKDWSKGISPIHFMIWCLQEETDAYLPNSDKIIFSLLMHGVKVAGMWEMDGTLYGTLERILESAAGDPDEIEVIENIINYLKMSETLTKKIRKKQRKRPKSGSKKPKKKKSKKKKKKTKKKKDRKN